MYFHIEKTINEILIHINVKEKKLESLNCVVHFFFFFNKRKSKKGECTSA